MLRKCMIPLLSVVGLVLALSYPVEAREAGSQIDPNGGRSLATTSEGERGSVIDPNGGRSLATTSEGERGSSIDPDGAMSPARAAFDPHG